MKKESKKRSGPPPLPDVTEANGAHVEPPPKVEDTSTDNAASPQDPIAEFLSRAGAVLALERGMNARSRVKLAAIADELGLSDADFDQVMEKLLGGESAAKKELSREELRQLRRQKRAFHNHVGETLMALPHGVLTSSMERMLVQDGVASHGQLAEDAQADILKLSKQLGIRRITQEEAERHVAGLADHALANSGGVLRPDLRKRIIAEASRWGLTPDQVEPIFRERMSHVRMGERKEQMRMVMLISASAAVLVGVLGMIAWMAFSRSLPGPPVVEAPADGVETPADGTTPATDGEAPAATVEGATSTKLGVPDWWDDKLASFIANVRLRVPALADELYRLRSPDADVRTDAYTKLLTAANKQELSSGERAVLAQLFAHAYAVDPSDECAAAMLGSWLDLVTAATSRLPDDFLPYEQALWTSDTAGAALMPQLELSDTRRVALLDALERTYQTSFDRSLPPLELQRDIHDAAVATLLKSLSRRAKENVDLAVDLHVELLKQVKTNRNRETLDRVTADYLREVVPALGDRWEIYEDLIRRTALSEDPLNVLQMVELFEASEQDDLQGFLGAQLIVRTGITLTERPTAEELAVQVREALGVRAPVRPVDAAQRYAEWREAAQEQLDQAIPPGDETEAILQDIIDTARLATLGAALSEGELAAAEFNALWEAEAPQLKEGGSGTSRTPPRAPRVSTSMLKSLDRNIDSLRGFNRLDKGRRVAFLQLIGGYGGSVTDVQPEQGRVIAQYLTAAKPVDEHERVMELAAGVLRWRMVRLGIADEIAESRLRREHLAELLSAALHRDVDVSEDGWQTSLQGELLANVARELETEASLTGSSTDLADRAAEELTEYYRTLAKLRGVSASDYNKAHSPSQVLTLLIQKQAADLSALGLSAEQRQKIDRLPHDLIAIDYVAPNDLARMVAFQRLWVALVSIESTLDGSGASDLTAGEGVLSGDKDGATHLLEQVAAGERARLKLWLMRNQP